MIKDRIRELRRVPARDLLPNPNWRQHPRSQREALAAILAEVGYADAVLARELDDGRVQLIDGHLRQDLAGEETVPALILDVTEEEAAKILATHDPIAAMAGADKDALAVAQGADNARGCGNSSDRAARDAISATT